MISLPNKMEQGQICTPTQNKTKKWAIFLTFQYIGHQAIKGSEREDSMR